MKKLKIAMLSSNFIRIPPRPKDVPPMCSGAPERIVSILTNELVKRGHEVTLFASGDSETKAKLISVTKIATSQDKKISFIPALYTPEGKGMGSSRFHEPYEFLLISKAYQMAKNFNIIHSHFDIATAFFAPLVKTPTLSTLHSPLLGLRNRILSYFKNTQHYVSISDSQRKPLPDLNYAATIYHGLDLKKIPFVPKSDNYLVFTGRIHPSKGVKEAIIIAKRIKLPLLLMGSRGEENYWKKEILPEIDGKKVIYKGFLPQKEMYQLIGRARAYIFPLQWEEPFGLTLVEAMACGTPVVAFNRGSINEVVRNKKTGFVIPSQKNGKINLEEFLDALKEIETINRKDCRKWIEERFSIERMVKEYEKVYTKLLQ